MNAPVTIKGWCPTTLQPMESGDGLLVRARVRNATLTPAAASSLAACARDFGNGQIDLTQRANLQLRGVRTQTLLPLITALRLAGFVGAADDAGQAVNIVMSPLAGLDATMHCDPRPIAAAIEAGLLANDGFRTLPSKFGFAIDAGGVLPLGDVGADIVLTATEDGSFDLGVAGFNLVANVSANCAGSVALECTHAFQILRRDERRMLALVARIGGAAIFAEAGIDRTLLRLAALRSAPAHQAIGVFASAEQVYLGVVAPFGAWSHEDLEAAANIVAAAAGDIRVTTWRGLLLTGLRSDDATRACEHLARCGLILSPGDPRLAIAACIGAPACGAATISTRKLASDLAAYAPPTSGIALHVSGCAKGCAHPKAAPLTLVGNAGRYDLIVDGRPDDAPMIARVDAIAAQDIVRGHLAQ